MSFYESIIVQLIGPVDGFNKVFETPSKYIAGTLRVVLNGQVYEPDDTRKKWTELDHYSIEFETAPRPGDVIQAFYKDKDTDHLGLEDVKGSPFPPDGSLP